MTRWVITLEIVMIIDTHLQFLAHTLCRLVGSTLPQATPKGRQTARRKWLFTQRSMCTQKTRFHSTQAKTACFDKQLHGLGAQAQRLERSHVVGIHHAGSPNGRIIQSEIKLPRGKKSDRSRMARPAWGRAPNISCLQNTQSNFRRFWWVPLHSFFNFWNKWKGSPWFNLKRAKTQNRGR